MCVCMCVCVCVCIRAHTHTHTDRLRGKCIWNKKEKIQRRYVNKIIRSWKRYLYDCFMFRNGHSATLTIYRNYYKIYTPKNSP